MKKHNVAWLALGLLAVMAPRVEAQVWQFDTGPARRAWFGFSFQPTETRRPGERVITLTVTEVVKESPAEKGGLRTNDVIVSINGLNATEQLISSLGTSLEPGDTVTFRVRRAGREQNVRLVAGKPPANMLSNYGVRVMPDSVNRLMRVFVDSLRRGTMDTTFWRLLPGGDSAMVRILTRNDSVMRLWGDSARSRAFVRAFPRDSMPLHFRADSLFFTRPGAEIEIFRRGNLPDNEVVLRSWGLGVSAIAGAELQELNPELARYFKVTSGVLVIDSPDDTPARRAGLQAGDVITHAAGQSVANVPQLRRAIRDAQGASVKLDIVRDGNKQSLQLKK